jgi:hypothetical protein
MWDLWWTKWYWGRFSPSTKVSPANPHSTNCSILIIDHRGGYNRTTVADVPSGLSLTPPRETKKIKLDGSSTNFWRNMLPQFSDFKSVGRGIGSVM